MPRSPLRTNGRTIDATEAVKRMDKAIKRQTEPFTPEPDPQKRTEPRREENVAIETLRQGTQSPGRRTPASKRPRRRNAMH
jgi:hypothetical protein